MQLDKNFFNATLSGAHLNADFSFDSSFSVDTRTLQKGEVFVALQGEHVDGHNFIKEALEKNASGFILANQHRARLEAEYGTQLAKKNLLYVEDPCAALLSLASKWREQFSYPVIAITGTVGKTTTKELVANILRGVEGDYFTSYGNQNTRIGLALNMLKMRFFHKAAIFEVGISRRGEMKHLVELLKPTVSVITQIGHGHMAGLGALTDVAQEKRDIFSLFKAENVGIINGDQDILAKVSYDFPVMKFGFKMTNQIQARKILIKNNVISFILKLYNKKYAVMIKGSHEGRILNALAAAAITRTLGVSDDDIVRGLQKELVVQGRFEEMQLASGGILINDCYNSNPESIKAGILAFNAYETDKKKYLVLGDMLELGIDSSFWHRQAGRLIHKVSGIHHIVLIGTMVQWLQKTLPIHCSSTHFETWEAAEDFLKKLDSSDSIFYFKGSHGTGLHKLVRTFSFK
jgi:UDP-N-acetylmuramoyl-tripeptide--D-alanyl-D-alanine ligase